MTQALEGTAPAIVHIVDDDDAIRDAMQMLFESVSLATESYRNAQELLDGLQKLGNNPHGCILLDLRMPGMSGLELQRELDERDCRLPIIFITAHGDVNAAVRAMHGGAFDFLTKPVDQGVLIEKVDAAIRESQKQAEVSAKYAEVYDRWKSLTAREAEVLQWVTRGLASKQIASKLKIATKTIELHRAHMMHKMQAGSTVEVVNMYRIIAPDGETVSRP